MANFTQEKVDHKKIFEIAADIRKFEIGLFWQRSLFFWGFIAAAFVAYSETAKEPNPDHDLLLAIASFGVVCSMAWTLANRGSKYWQGAWEAKLETFEKVALGVALFSEEYTGFDNSWWGEARYSVSRLTIALSDFAVGLWVILGLRAIPGVYWPSCLNGSVLIPLVTLLYAFAMLRWCRSRKRTYETAK